MKLIPMLVLTAIALPAYAHGPTPQKTDESVLLKATPQAVWQQLSTPCAIATWDPDVTACEADGELKRTLTLKNGGRVFEEIDEILPDEMSISYRLGTKTEVKALAVSSLTGRIKVKAEDTGARVSWIARYYRADTTNEPPAGMDDAAARDSVTAYIKAALGGLDTALQKK